MTIGVLTSSRADFGIYLPLLKKLKIERTINLKMIVFGTHLSHKYGYTLKQIKDEGFKAWAKIKCLPSGDSPLAIAKSISQNIDFFSDFWNEHKKDFDLVLCLGDRYEMFAAVTAGFNFGIKFAHFHGGETSLGAIDEAFRHSITAMSTIHFTATKKAFDKVVSIKGCKKNIFHVGSMALDNIKNVRFLNKMQFKEKFKVFPENPVLVTFHPETINYYLNRNYVLTICNVLKKINKQIFITLPNADTGNLYVRKAFLDLENKNKNVHCFESLGTQGYFSAMKFCSFILGNSSSGIIEAASFGKYVINLGDRQKGRERSKNVYDCKIDEKVIVSTIRKVLKNPNFKGKNIYGKGNATDKVKKHLFSF